MGYISNILRNISTFFFILILCFLFIYVNSKLIYSQNKNVQKVSSKIPQNLKDPINTSYNDFAPSLTNDESQIFFNKKTRGYSNIYYSEKINEKWKKPMLVPNINSSYNDETPFITRDNKFLIFASDRDGSLSLPRDNDGKVMVSFDLYISQKTSAGWSSPIPLPGKVNTTFHERAPSFGYDGKTLYFTRWPFGNMTKAVIMQATLIDGQFLDVKSLPSPVNSSYIDTAIYPSPKKGVFYFTSNRPGGMGGYDIYRIEFKNNKWGLPVNPGERINSPQNEAFFSLVNDSIYFSSNREGSLGGFDIYSTYAEKPFIVVNLIDAKNKNPITGKITGILKEKNNKTSKTYKEVFVPMDGFEMEYPDSSDKITFLASKKGYLPVEENIDLKKFKGRHITIPLKKSEANQKFTLHSIYFDSNSDRIQKDSFVYLDALIRFLKENSSVKIKIIGHTDLHGSEKYNLVLSKKRAKSVGSYLVKGGIDKKRILAEGRGFSNPLVHRKGEPYDSRNRRTEFEIIQSSSK